jgi:hypothetical protein
VALTPKNMSIDIVQHVAATESPFDSIRRFDAEGNEYWMGRELMILLGYKTWQKFSDAIERAKITCQLNNEPEPAHFQHLPGSVNGYGTGRTADDYRLSRNACYWIAMAGDVRKPEIAAAHQYFAVKTRQAETVIPQQNDRLKELELQVKIMEMEHRNLRQRDTMVQLHGVKLGLTLIGHGGQIIQVEKTVTEVVNPQTGRSDRILTADQLKRAVKEKSGQNLKTMKSFTDKILAVGRDDLLLPVERSTTSFYVDADKLDEALAVVYGGTKQRVITLVDEQG